MLPGRKKIFPLDLRQYAMARGLTVREYVDAGFSGAKQSRPALDRLMDDARKRQFDCVLVWRFDRFARSTKHLLLALEEFRSLGVQFISYQENIDTTSPLGQALFTIVSAVAIVRKRLSNTPCPAFISSSDGVVSMKAILRQQSHCFSHAFHHPLTRRPAC